MKCWYKLLVCSDSLWMSALGEGLTPTQCRQSTYGEGEGVNFCQFHEDLLYGQALVLQTSSTSGVASKQQFACVTVTESVNSVIDKRCWHHAQNTTFELFSEPLMIYDTFDFTALRCIQRGHSHRQAVYPSVTRVNCDNERKFCRHSYTIWKENSSAFSDTNNGWWGTSLSREILCQTDPPSF